MKDDTLKTDADGRVICPRCRRVVDPWHLKRGNNGNLCSPKGWVNCIRNDGPYFFVNPEQCYDRR
jgi:hypothetical protein